MKSSLKSNSDSVKELKTNTKKQSETIKKIQQSSVQNDNHKSSDDNEMYTRRNSIRIYGIPEKENEDTTMLALKLFKDNLKLLDKTDDKTDMPLIQNRDIDRSHRVSRARDDSSPELSLLNSYGTQTKRKLSTLVDTSKERK